MPIGPRRNKARWWANSSAASSVSSYRKPRRNPTGAAEARFSQPRMRQIGAVHSSQWSSSSSRARRLAPGEFHPVERGGPDLGADELGAVGVALGAVVLEPVGVDEPDRVVLGVVEDVVEEGVFFRHVAPPGPHRPPATGRPVGVCM